MNKPTVLEVRNLTRRFGGLVAVNNISFDVHEHEVVGLIGPNGSGKTTTMNLISGALPPSSGEIWLGDTCISRLPARRIARSGVARTFQLVRMLPSLSILENVKAGAVFGHQQLWGSELDHHARRLLERVGVMHDPDAPTSSLTYIDQKRVELARALASNPRVLLLDEWLAGLNPTELQQGIELIADLRDEGRTILLVEHVMDAIRSLCDRCVVMSSGSKISEGGTEDVLSDAAVIEAYLGKDDE
ncbi:ABC transporter ATP-binding protein [Marinospirillum alkaliphilum]|uniref:Branched-chain amino acid transport system ATP-binding protein n=1 Tax=Marinospirillum alkaliphilum DSM 21637 TaxID=1122209 RepID=A0A1K1TH40_9GAMM|nr:ABC transporter ATP-binding protein [Marinospirillum alkaliphilum]SFW99740.1 branched-chain amino acid transport system ATP-binding protein [Marinospirillum alkaliphilum DSM 21637]